MASRYENRLTAINTNERYRSFFKDRNINFIEQFRTPKLKHPTPDQIRKLEMIGHIWSVGDRYYKLAHTYYKNERMWWVIAWFNQKPTESHLEIGDVIQIPLPLDRVLNYLGI
ncbi:hypothetical protein CL634_10890 [bacterium]|nr:hypothetical protein [bacterium]